MAVTSFFLEALKENNVKRVRDMMADSLIRDPLFNEFEEMQREAGKFSMKPFEAHDGKPFNQDSSAWNKSYLDSAILDLRKNFSRERVAHVKNVCRYIYSDKISDKIKDNNHRKPASLPSRPVKNLRGIIIALAAALAIAIIIILWLLLDRNPGRNNENGRISSGLENISGDYNFKNFKNGGINHERISSDTEYISSDSGR